MRTLSNKEMATASGGMIPPMGSWWWGSWFSSWTPIRRPIRIRPAPLPPKPRPLPIFRG